MYFELCEYLEHESLSDVPIRLNIIFTLIFLFNLSITYFSPKKKLTYVYTYLLIPPKARRKRICIIIRIFFLNTGLSFTQNRKCLKYFKYKYNKKPTSNKFAFTVSFNV